MIPIPAFSDIPTAAEQQPARYQMPRFGDSLRRVWLTILLPIHFCELLLKEWREPSPFSERYVKKFRAEYAPPPLPTRRPRKLTLGGNPKLELQHKDKSKSKLFKLPLEIRQRIYEYILVDRQPLIHINQSFKTLVYRRCRKQIRGQTCKSNIACFHGTIAGPRGYYKGDDPNTYTQSDGGILPLLISCRQMYVLVT